MEIKCLTKLIPDSPEESILDLWDIIEMEFQLSEPYTGELFLCIDLADEMTYLFRENLQVEDGYIKARIYQNFIDGVKSLPDSILDGDPTIRLAFQAEMTFDGNFTVPLDEIELPNKWYSQG